MRPTAPQNNPANISATGGNGQSGAQAPKYIPGMAYGQGQATMQQQQGAKMAGPMPTPAPAPVSAMPMAEVRPLTAPSDRPDEPVTAGVDFGPGPGSESLMMPQQQQESNDPDINLVREVFPIIELWASQVDTSQGTKDYVNYLRTIL
jgi:hypothetical protein